MAGDESAVCVCVCVYATDMCLEVGKLSKNEAGEVSTYSLK